MGIIIKIVLAITAMISMSLSSIGFRSDNMITGFIFVLIAIFALFFLMRFLWELIGCALTIGLIVGLIALVLYVSGAFTDDSGFLPEEVLTFMESKKETPQNQTLYGKAVALSGDMINIGKNFYLYGISAPKIDQVCKNSANRNYACGKASQKYLQEKVSNQEPVCTILGSAPVKNGFAPVICNVGEYDLGALMVASGWAIPDISGGIVYVPYEAEAKKRKIGMWQGNFSSPWEWERVKHDQQQRMQSIKVEQPKKEQSLFMKNFLN